MLLLAARCRAASGEVENLVARVLASYPHDPAIYTQGLLFHDGTLFESGGQYGESRLREVEISTGRVLREIELRDDLFAEGLERVGRTLYQLTWREGLVLRHGLDDFEPLVESRYSGEGWGLCGDDTGLWMSDGSARLVLRDPATFASLREFEVHLNDRPVDRLNELECAEGWIYANVYGSEQIVRIDPVDGRVSAVIDASGLLTPSEREGIDVFNGIAYDPRREVFYVTGKYWPRLFEVVFEPR